MNFPLPPIKTTLDGAIRHVGFEIEFGGLKLGKSCVVIKKLFGGKIRRKNPFSLQVAGTRFGDFTVASDSRFLSEERFTKYVKGLKPITQKRIRQDLEKFFADKVLGIVMPCEISMPPLPVTNLEPAEILRQSLYEHGATGTYTNIFAAFGVHINVELPAVDVKTILNYLRAFLILYPWLKQESQVNVSRKISPYIRSFPQSYVDLVLAPNYHPTVKQLIRDYLIFNPTRNRPLDMLPLFSCLNNKLVKLFIAPDTKVKPRPALHYRLPNCDIDNPRWSLALEWNRWLEVERLAARLAIRPEILCDQPSL